ncbi:hypothetical protein [Erwinia psidii]|nr:hypothetical protein [Erwinia psidii]
MKITFDKCADWGLKAFACVAVIGAGSCVLLLIAIIAKGLWGTLTS